MLLLLQFLWYNAQDHEKADLVPTTHSCEVLSGSNLNVITVEDGILLAALPNDVIPTGVLENILVMTAGGMTMKDCVIFLRRRLVPDGYEPYPFQRHTPETYLHSLRSLVGTYTYRKCIEDYMAEGVRFDLHLYVPEVDRTTGEVFHERSDHGHLVKCIAGTYAVIVCLIIPG